jgi:putative DNA primase/helicase
VSTAVRSEAIGYRQRGLAPIPIKERSKEPNLKELRPYLNRKATREELEAWNWTGVGIVTGQLSGVLVLDVDGPEGEAELQKYRHPVTPMVRTAGGGLHLYFKHPDYDVKTGIRVAPGLDVKAAGGYVAAPPTIGPNGARYEWIVSPDEAEFAEPPDWLMDILTNRRLKAPAGPVGERIPQGQRNKALASIAGTMRRRGMGETEILAALRVTNEQRCQPLLEDEEVAKIAASVARYEPAGDLVHVSFNGYESPKPPQGYNLTDLGNAERFVAQHGENVRYCYSWRTWLFWTGTRWERDNTGQVHRLAKETVRSIYREASDSTDEDRRKALAKHAAASESETRIRAMIELAKSEVPASPDDLDADPWLLNVLNGTIDLRTEELREHRREDLITKIAPVEYTPRALAPTWGAFLERVLPGEELRRFVQRAAGYSATGATSEQCMFIHHGPGANGKSTFQETLSAALGDYAMRTPTETLLVKRSGGVPNDIARLKGARFVTASETEEGRRLAESLVKDLTGQDTISARFMWAEWFDFKPTHTLHLSTNHRPEIRGTDAAIWRRIRLIPWAVTIPPTEQDRKLADKLRDELPGVLAWIVRGCSEWRREGLQAPEEVRKATMAYRAEMDVLAAFLADCCLRSADEEAFAGELWGAWKRWCEETGEQAGTQKRFGGRLAERGFLNHRDSKTGRKVWAGLSLRPNWEARAGISLNHSNVRFAGNYGRTEPSEPKNNKVLKDLPRKETTCEKGSEGSEGSEGSAELLSTDLPAGESATLEQLQRIRELVAQGRSKYAARVEVLAKGHPLDCECEVCSS